MEEGTRTEEGERETISGLPSLQSNNAQIAKNFIALMWLGSTSDL